MRSIASTGLAALLLLIFTSPTTSEALGPSVVPTAEGQLGQTPAPLDSLQGTTFESIRGQAGDVFLGGLTFFGGIMPPPPEFSFLLDRIHTNPDPNVADTFNGTFVNVERLAPESGSSTNATNDGEFVAFAFAVDGSMPQTMTVRVATYDETGTRRSTASVDDISTFPDFNINDTGVTVDRDGRTTVVYTDLPPGVPASVKMSQFDGLTGTPLISNLPVTDAGHASAAVALLDPAGDRMIIPTSDFASIRGNIVDLSGASPVVLPEFPISTTPGFANFDPQVAADPTTGTSTVVWENLTGIQGDPSNVRGRRFDAMGNPIGGEFLVNTTTANAQAQPSVAYGPDSLSAVAWAGDSAVQGDVLDVFLQVYDATGNPIDGEIRVNTTTAEVQDRPTVRFLPNDSRDRPQVLVAWRDVGNAAGNQANGTGTSYRCFAIEGINPVPMEVFADGFESGDTTSWSDREP